MPAQDRRWHDANGGADSDPVFWKLEGNQALWCAASAGVGLLLFRLLHGKLDSSIPVSLGVALVPVIATTWFVLALRTGKPESYAGEFIVMCSHRVSGWLSETLGMGSCRSLIGPAERPLLHPFLEDDDEITH